MNPMRLLLGAACLLGLAWTSGCTDEQIAEMQRWDRRFKYPDDYKKDLPLGAGFDTRPEIDQLADDMLRQHMYTWLGERENYLQAWRRGGDYDNEAIRLRNRLRTLTAVIQTRRDQLVGRPLTKG